MVKDGMVHDPESSEYGNISATVPNSNTPQDGITSRDTYTRSTNPIKIHQTQGQTHPTQYSSPKAPALAKQGPVLLPPLVVLTSEELDTSSVEDAHGNETPSGSRSLVQLVRFPGDR